VKLLRRLRLTQGCDARRRRRRRRRKRRRYLLHTFSEYDLFLMLPLMDINISFVLP
jgi:hypothetical protein